MTAAPALASAPKLKHTDFEKLFAEIAIGRLPVPNFEEIDLSHGVAHIASATLLVGGPVCWARIAEIDQGKGNYARFFREILHGQFTGSGLVMVFGAGTIGKVGRFAICKHNKVLRSDASPRRGWLPGSCEHCGIDLSTDSGG